MKKLYLIAAFLFCFFFQSMLDSTVEGITINPIIHEIATFIENNESIISPVIQTLLGDFLTTSDDRFLELAFDLLSDDDPLYVILQSYFASKESSVAPKN